MSWSIRRKVLATALLLPGCGSDPSGGDSAATEASSTTATTTPDPSTSAASTTDGSSGPPILTTTATTVPLPNCGNDEREDPEECDDGNLDPNDGCEADCTLSVDTRLWQDSNGGAANVPDSALGVAIDDQDNGYVIGFEVNDIADPNIWLRSYTPDGTERWTTTFDPSGGGVDRGYGIAIDPDGNLLVSGSVGEGDADSDIWFAKLNPDGTEIWSRTVAGPDVGSDSATSVATDAAGNLLLGGFVRAGNNDNDLWVAKYDPDGNELWSDIVAGPDGLDDRVQGVASDADGNLIAIGFISRPEFNRDVWLRKYDPAGVELWTTIYDSPTSGNDSAFAVNVALDGAIGVAGAKPITANNDNVWLAVFEPSDGALDFQRDFGGIALLSDRALGITSDSQSNFIIAGYKGVTQTNTDIYMRKYDGSGNIVWTQNFQGMAENQDLANAIAVDSKDNLWVVGELSDEGNDGQAWVGKFGPG